MTRTPSILADVLADCDAHGIRLALADGGGLAIDAPKDALTPNLLARLKEHKADLLVMLRPAPEVAPINQADAATVWQAALDRLEGDPLFPPDVMEGLRAADARLEDDPDSGEANESIELIDPPDACPDCGSLELWQTVAGDLYGRTPGRWRCLRCDPRTTAQRLRERAAQIRPR